MDKVKIEYDEYVRWKAELEAEQKVLSDNFEKSQEKIIRESVRYRVLSQISPDRDEVAYSKLQVAREEKEQCEKDMYQRLNTIGKLLMIINGEIMMKGPIKKLSSEH